MTIIAAPKENLITDDEDYIAISARRIANQINRFDDLSVCQHANLVKTEGNCLFDQEPFFTTLATIAECNTVILYNNFPKPITKPLIVKDPDELYLFDDKINEVWEHLTENIEIFAAMLNDKTPSGDDKRREMRRDYLLGKPVPQVCLFNAFMRLTHNHFSLQAATDRLNKIDWRQDAQIWNHLLIIDATILPHNTDITADIICYMAGKKFKKEEEKLLQRYRAVFPQNEQAAKQLPAKITM